jgi:hypothetical protein
MDLKVVFSLAVFATLALAISSSTDTFADRRMYAETYEAVTAPKGELDVESWTTYGTLGELDGGPASRGIRQMIELEYGLTDRWDVALYNMFDGITSGMTASGYAGLKLESRYRPTFRGQWIVDPVFYIELQELFRGDAAQKAELKLIVAKDFGPVNAAVNVAFEAERKTDGTFNPEFEWAAGVAYSFVHVAFGAEGFGKVEPDGARVWLGPAVSVAGSTHTAMHGIWLTIGGGPGLTSLSDSFYLRAILGLQF